MTRMFETAIVLSMLAFTAAGCASGDDELDPVGPTEGVEGDVADVVRAYYEAFNAHEFEGVDDVTAEDWNVIDPNGDWTRGQADAVKVLKDKHATALQDLKLRVEDMTIGFAAPDVAIATVGSREYFRGKWERRLRATFVVVERDERWWLTQTQHTFVADGEPSFTGNLTEDDLSDVGGEVEPEEARDEKVRAALQWFDDLPRSHTFDEAGDYAAENLHLIGPTGYWSRGRNASMAGLEEVDTTFLDGITFTPLSSSLRFVTDDVAVATEITQLSPFADQKHLQLAVTNVVVNHDGRWLLRLVQSTIVEGTDP